MNSPSMAPRSYAYSGGDHEAYFDPQRSEVENAMGASLPTLVTYVLLPDVSIGSGSSWQGGGILSALLNEIAGKV
jgi:hypothetical protein